MDLLAQLRDVFAAPTLTEEQAVTRVRQASGAEARVTTAETEARTLREQAGQKDQTIADLRSKVPAAADPAALAEWQGIAGAKFDLLEATGRITPAQRDGFKVMLTDDGKADGKPNPVMFAKGTNGKSPWQVLAASLETNEPHRFGQQTTAQPYDRVVPGDPNAAAAEEAAIKDGKARADRLNGK